MPGSWLWLSSSQGWLILPKEEAACTPEELQCVQAW